MEHDHARVRLLWTAAGVTLALGLLLTLRSLAGLSRDTERYEKRRSDLSAMQALGTNVASREAVLQTWSQTAGPVRPLADLLKTEGAPSAATLHDLEPVPGPAGWQVRRTAAVLTNVGYDRLAETVRAAGASRPPWTLAECLIQASERPGIAARMELVFETAERTGK